MMSDLVAEQHPAPLTSPDISSLYNALKYSDD